MRPSATATAEDYVSLFRERLAPLEYIARQIIMDRNADDASRALACGVMAMVGDSYTLGELVAQLELDRSRIDGVIRASGGR